MRNIRFCISTLFLLCFIFLGRAYSQTAAPTPEVVIDDNEVVKINTNLIQIDAIVTDKNGKVISDLKPEDFELTENGKKRQIVGFSFVNTDVQAASLSKEILLSSSNSLLSDTPPRTVGQVGRIYAIVVDDLKLSKTGMDYAKKDLTKFLQTEVKPGDLVAVIKTSGSIGIMQKFTNDKEELLASIDSLKWQPLTSVGVSSFAPMEISFSSQVLSSMQGGISDALMSKITGAENVGEGLRESVNGTGGLQVLAKVIEAMKYMQGKKTVLYVSHGFSPIGGDNADAFNRNTLRMYTESDKSVMNAASGGSIALVDADSITVGGRSYVVNNFLRSLTEMANRNGVSIFTIDPRGAAATNISATDSTGSGLGSMSREQMDGGVTSRNDQIRLQQDTLKYLARETGGKAFVNSNEVASDLKESLDIQKGYYLLAYEPDTDTFDPKNDRYNKFDIKVKRSGADVSYRTGFFNTVIENKTKAASEAQTILQKFLTPYNFADIGVELSSLYAGTAGNKSTIRAFVNILPKDLTITDDAATGKKVAKFDMYVAVFNDQGLSAGSAAQNFTVSIDPKTAEVFSRSGLISSMAFGVDKPGVYRVKVLVKDSGSNKIGTISQNIYVPDFEKKTIAFSGLLLQTFSAAEWAELQKNPAAANGQKMQVDTAFRHYKTGQVLSYTYALNVSPKSNDAKISLSTKVMKDGQLVLTGNSEELAATPGLKANRRNAINLGTDMKPGKYTLLITAAGDKSKSTETQSIDFEIID